MINIEDLTKQIKRNCNISDAKYWGYYSICGLLLRLRELYRSEKGISPWEGIQREKISEWIEERENLWKKLENKELNNILIGGRAYGPFEVSKINEILHKEKLIYGAGYGLHMKPSFFLADLQTKYSLDGYTVCISGNEYARDLAEYPAMMQERVIYGRLATTKIILWGEFEELSCKATDSPLAFAFSKYNFTCKDIPIKDINERMSELAMSELETYIYHEIGEAYEGERLGDEWERLLVEFSGTKIEHFIRGVKDLLSDTSEKGMAKHIINHNKEGSLGFYIVFLKGYRRLLFPEIVEAFKRFIKTNDWKIIEEARMKGYKKAKGFADILLSLYKENESKKKIIQYIENEILSKLS